MYPCSECLDSRPRQKLSVLRFRSKVPFVCDRVSYVGSDLGDHQQSFALLLCSICQAPLHSKSSYLWTNSAFFLLTTRSVCTAAVFHLRTTVFAVEVENPKFTQRESERLGQHGQICVGGPIPGVPVVFVCSTSTDEFEKAVCVGQSAQTLQEEIEGKNVSVCQVPLDSTKDAGYCLRESDRAVFKGYPT